MLHLLLTLLLSLSITATAQPTTIRDDKPLPQQ